MENRGKNSSVESGLEFEEIFGIPVAAHGTRKQVKMCNLNQRIIGLSFDTTPANSEMLTGVCMRIESYLGHSLL